MTEYRGRFAPTPSGPLHFGSLFAAVVSYLDARSNGGAWLLRIDDLDPPREQPGAARAIMSSLEQHGLIWDETETYQSRQAGRYESRLQTLQQRGRLFWCTCSRKQLKGCTVYPGTCRMHQQPRVDSAVRLRVDQPEDFFIDQFQGRITARVAEQYGDVILKRRDHLYAYQLAVVSDDLDAGITHIVRGIDLMPSTFWQREVYRQLNVSPPHYAHFAVLHARQSDQKLSKQNLAPAINDQTVEKNLLEIFRLLELRIEPDTAERMLNQASKLYQPASLFGKRQVQVDGFQLN